MIIVTVDNPDQSLVTVIIMTVDNPDQSLVTVIIVTVAKTICVCMTNYCF